MAELPIAPVKRIIQNTGAQRVSEDAAVALADTLEEFAQEVATEAIKLANHAGRKTVNASDIELALQ